MQCEREGERLIKKSKLIGYLLFYGVFLGNKLIAKSQLSKLSPPHRAGVVRRFKVKVPR